MKNNISTSMLEEILALDNIEQENVLQFCKDSESMTDDEVAAIKVTKRGPKVLKTLQHRAVRSAKSAIRRRKRKVEKETKQTIAPPPSEKELPESNPAKETCIPEILSPMAMKMIEWARDTFPNEIKTSLKQKIDHIIHVFRRLPKNEIIEARNAVRHIYTDILDSILATLVNRPSVSCTGMC